MDLLLSFVKNYPDMSANVLAVLLTALLGAIGFVIVWVIDRPKRIREREILDIQIEREKRQNKENEEAKLIAEANLKIAEEKLEALNEYKELYGSVHRKRKQAFYEINIAKYSRRNHQFDLEDGISYLDLSEYSGGSEGQKGSEEQMDEMNSKLDTDIKPL